MLCSPPWSWPVGSEAAYAAAAGNSFVMGCRLPKVRTGLQSEERPFRVRGPQGLQTETHPLRQRSRSAPLVNRYWPITSRPNSFGITPKR